MQQTADCSRVWLPDIVEYIARSLPANEVVCVLRLVHKATLRQFADRKTLRLSLPSPAHVFIQRWGSPDAFRGLTQKQRLKLLCLTAASGSIANLEVAQANAGVQLTGELLEAAAEAGQLEACIWLRERDCPWGYSLDAAAKGGHRHVCEWLLASGCPCLPTALYAAARDGHKGLMHWLLQRLWEDGAADVDGVRLLEASSAGFNLAPLQRLHQQLLAGQQHQGNGGVRASFILAAAASSSTPDWQAKVGWLEGLGYPRSAGASTLAAQSPDDAVGRLQWLHSRGYPLSQEAADQAAKRGDLASLRFLMEETGVRPTDRASVLAAADGHLTALQYLHASGFPMDASRVARHAAEGGHLPVVVWAVEALGGVTPVNTADLLDVAAHSGNIQLMTWLGERDWTCGDRAVRNAASCGCEEALEWLVEQGCPLPADGAPYVAAARNGDLATVRCLHRLDCPWGPDQLPRCIRRKVPVPMLQCLLGLGCPLDWDALMAVAEARDPGQYRTALLEWLGEQLAWEELVRGYDWGHVVSVLRLATKWDIPHLSGACVRILMDTLLLLPSPEPAATTTAAAATAAAAAAVAGGQPPPQLLVPFELLKEAERLGEEGLRDACLARIGAQLNLATSSRPEESNTGRAYLSQLSQLLLSAGPPPTGGSGTDGSCCSAASYSAGGGGSGRSPLEGWAAGQLLGGLLAAMQRACAQLDQARQAARDATTRCEARVAEVKAEVKAAEAQAATAETETELLELLLHDAERGLGVSCPDCDPPKRVKTVRALAQHKGMVHRSRKGWC